MIAADPPSKYRGDVMWRRRVSYPATPTFWMDPSGETARGARRYVGCPGRARCEGERWYHDALVWVDRVPTVTKTDLDGTRVREGVPDLDPDAEFWPTCCERCLCRFGPDAPRQTFAEEIFTRISDGAQFTLPSYAGDAPPDAPKAPAGAMYHAYWLPSAWRGEDGIALSVVLPNGNIWHVDSQASNCTDPTRPHKCWVRTGDPRTGKVTVGKDGDTCAAGAGSILSGDYHGFLIGGQLSAG